MTKQSSSFARALGLSLTVALFACGHRTPARPDVAAAVLPPPPRPSDVLLSAHFGQPRATVDALSALTGQRIPFELGLALALGVDGTVMAASDTTRPIDLLVTGTIEHPDVVFVFTPATASQFRSTLSNRFRLVRVETLGERLDPLNQPPRVAPRGTRCAVVGVPGPLPARIVCANRLEALEHAGRFAAYESQRLADTRGDVMLDVDGATARSALGPLATRAIDENNQALAATAADERRRHARAPDLGDPEAALNILASGARSLVRELDDVQHVTLRGSVTGEAVTLETDLTLDAQGHAMITADALSRVGIDTSHPLASRLPPDAFAAFATRSRADDRASQVHAITSALVAILGSRVADPAAALRELDGLFAQVGEETAVGVAHEPEGGFEFSAVFSQRDDGTAARGSLAALARTPWLRAARFGDTGLTVTFANNVLTLRPQESRTTPPPARPASATPTADAGAAPTSPPAPPPAVAITVVGNALVVVVGGHLDAALAALAARGNGPAPAVLGSSQGSAVAGIDLAGLVRTASADEHPVVRATYSAERNGASVVGHGRLVLPPAMIRGALRGALQPTR